MISQGVILSKGSAKADELTDRFLQYYPDC